MASNSIQSLSSNGLVDGYALSDGYTAYVTKWCDKRSAINCNISCSLTGATPAGAWEIQLSNAPENVAQYASGGGPKGGTGLGTNPIDTVRLVLSGSATVHGNGTISTNVVTVAAAGTVMFNITTSARWIRAVYTPSNSISGLTAYVYASVPFESA